MKDLLEIWPEVNSFLLHIYADWINKKIGCRVGVFGEGKVHKKKFLGVRERGRLRTGEYCMKDRSTDL